MKSPQTTLLLKLMRMDDHTYGELVMKRAELYLRVIMPGEKNKQLRKKIYLQDNFWKWWRKQWERRNLILVAELHLESLADVHVDSDLMLWCRNQFYDAHSIGKLNILPNKWVMATAFEAMVIEKNWKV